MSARTRFLALLAGALILAGCGSSTSSTSSDTSSSAPGASSSTTSTYSSSATVQMGFEGVPIEQGPLLAPASTTQTGTVHGIQCGATEQLAYHIHAHLAVYADGSPRTLPGGIGIPGSHVVPTAEGPVAAGGQCIYWLHTHAPDGVIHVESPRNRIYTLGDFFAEWHQPLSATRVAGASGKVTAVVNGRPWTKSPAAIPLEPRAVIQLSVGSPTVPFTSIDWSQTQL
jgi:hypothetical protein